MGLFKKRSDAELVELRNEMATMRLRLDEADAAKAELGSQVHQISTRLDTVPATVEAPPTAPSIEPAEIDELRARIKRLSDRADAVESAESVLIDQVNNLHTRLNTPVGPPPTEPPPAPPAPAMPAPSPSGADLDDHAELSELRTWLEELTDRVNSLDLNVLERLDVVDHRITTVSVELANQLSELGAELDGLGDRPTGAEPLSDDQVDALRDAQTRLAQEQARYQIAFREELADLAERLRHPGR